MTGTVPQDNRQAQQYLSITTTAGAGKLQLSGIAGEEHLSRVYAYTLDLYTNDGEIDAEALVGTAASVKIKVGEDLPERYIHGVLAEVSVVQVLPGKKRVQLSARLVPKLALLDMQSDCRIFQNKSVKDIITAILDEAGVTDREIKTTATYEAREYCVQWRETNLNFIQRLMEDEGIFYWFEHTSSAHKMVIADDADGHTDCPGIAALEWRPTDEMADAPDAVNDCALERRLTPNAVGLRAWNFETPSTSLHVKKEGQKKDRSMQDWGHTHTASAAGERLAGIRLGSLELPGKMLRMRGGLRALAAGRKVAVSNHPRSEVNGSWVALSARLSATPEKLDADVLLFPAATTFRPPREASRPFIPSTQTAIVVGPSGDEIHTDKYGRVKVQFHWDREGKKDENSSCFIRVAQGWAGTGWGSMFIPRVGMEVVVSFLDGDPDRPLVTGCVYNAEQTVPYALPGEMTKSTVKSRTTKNGSGKFNEIRFEDKADSEEIYVHAQKDMKLEILNDETRTVKNDRTTTVEHDDKTTVKNHRTIEVQEGNETHKVLKGKRTVEVKDDETHNSQAKFTHDVTGDYKLTVGGDMTVEVTGSLTIKAKDVTIKATSQGVTIEAPQNVSVKATQNVELEATSQLNMKGTAGAKLESPAKIDVKASAQLNCEGAMANFKATGMGEVSAGGILTVKGSLVKIN